VSVVEIYNETIRDLLPKKKHSSSGNGHQSFTAHNSVLVKLRDNADGETVSNERLKTVKSEEEALMYLRRACLNRAVGATHANEQSSRSHFIFTLHVTWRHAITKARYSGKLNLVDLAGSERLLKSYFEQRETSTTGTPPPHNSHYTSADGNNSNHYGLTAIERVRERETLNIN